MTTRLCLMLAAAICTLAVGCRQDPHLNYYFEMAANEQRMLEDELWRLEQENESLAGELSACQEKVTHAPKTRASSEPDELDIQVAPERKPKRPSDDGKNGRSADGPREKVRSNGRAIDPDDIELNIEPGTEVEPDRGAGDEDAENDASTRANRSSEELPDPDADSDSEAAPDEGHPIDDSPDADEPDAAEPRADEPRADEEASADTHDEDLEGAEEISNTSGYEEVTKVYLHPSHTSGLELDSQPGDDGITVVLEPRSAADRYVAEPGSVSIALIDPETRNRVARWDFAESESPQHLEPLPGRGLRFELPWPEEGAPQVSKLRVAVRFTTFDGRQLEASRNIVISLPGDAPATWTPRSRARGALNGAPSLQGPAAEPDGNGDERLRASTRPHSAAAIEPDSPAGSNGADTSGTGAPAAVEPVRRPGSRREQATRPRPTWRPYR